MSRRYKYLFTEEWYEGDKNHVSAYGKRSRKLQELSDLNKECHLVLQLRQKNRVTFETKKSWEISS